jgi:hypothetical protein
MTVVMTDDVMVVLSVVTKAGVKAAMMVEMKAA